MSLMNWLMLSARLHKMPEWERSHGCQHSVLVKAGIQKAKEQGKKVGRRPKLSPANQARVVLLIRDGRVTARQAASFSHVSLSSIRRYLETAKE